MNNPTARVYQTTTVRKRIDIPTIWANEPRHLENILTEMCYLYRMVARVATLR